MIHDYLRLGCTGSAGPIAIIDDAVAKDEYFRQPQAIRILRAIVRCSRVFFFVRPGHGLAQ